MPYTTWASITPVQRELRPGWKIYEGFEVFRFPRHFKFENTPKICNRYPAAAKVPITRKNGIRPGNMVFDEDEGRVGIVNDKLNMIIYNKYLSAFLSFKKDDRHCWVTNGMRYIDPSIAGKFSEEIRSE
mgnify:CR=1 FL=1